MFRVYIVDVPPDTILDMDYYEELHILKNHTDKEKNIGRYSCYAYGRTIKLY